MPYLLSPLEISQLEADNEGMMGDRCNILTRTNTVNSSGQPIATWTTAHTAVPCGFEFSPFKFRSRETGFPGAESSEILVRARISKDYYATIATDSRLVLTSRFGETLPETETYEVRGFTERGPSALIVNLLRVNP